MLYYVWQNSIYFYYIVEKKLQNYFEVLFSLSTAFFEVNFTSHILKKTSTVKNEFMHIRLFPM